MLLNQWLTNLFCRLLVGLLRDVLYLYAIGFRFTKIKKIFLYLITGYSKGVDVLSASTSIRPNSRAHTVFRSAAYCRSQTLFLPIFVTFMYAVTTLVYMLAYNGEVYMLAYNGEGRPNEISDM